MQQDIHLVSVLFEINKILADFNINYIFIYIILLNRDDYTGIAKSDTTTKENIW